MLLVLVQAGQGVSLPEGQQLVLGADAARRPVKAGAGVGCLGGKRVRVWGGGGDVEVRTGSMEGQGAPGSQCVIASPGQVVLRGVEGGWSVVGATFVSVITRVFIKFFLCCIRKGKKENLLNVNKPFSLMIEKLMTSVDHLQTEISCFTV